MKKQFDSAKAYGFIEKINFVRVGGTPEEKKAAKIISEKLESFNIRTTFHDFPMATSYGSELNFKFLEPYEKEIEISHRILSGSTPPDGLVTGFKYIDSGGERYCKDIKGKVVMTTGKLDRILYERLTRYKAAAVIIPMNYGQELFGITFNIDFIKKFGELPVCFIKYNDALEMVKNKISKVFIKIIDNPDHNATGRNIIGEIPGTQKPDEEILLIAHYDSTLNPGIYDNAAGTATIVELARNLVLSKPKRTIKFIFFTGEEWGLRGSKAYVKMLKENDFDLFRIKLVVNFDLGGTILGKNCIRVTGNDEILGYFNNLNLIEDWDFYVQEDIYSSDNMPFGLEGIPAVNIYRETPGLGHFWIDTIENISAEAFDVFGEFSLKLISGIVDAPVFPFKRKVSDSIQKKIIKYFQDSSAEEPRDIIE
jgi:hypothetical protein